MRVLKFLIYFAKPYKIYIVGLLLATCLWTLEGTLRPYIIKNLVDVAAPQTSDKFWFIWLLYGLLQLIKIVSWLLNDYCVTRFTPQMRSDIIEYFMTCLYSYSYGFFQGQATGKLTSKLEDIFQLLSHLIRTIINEFFHFILLIFFSLFLLAEVESFFALSLVGWLFAFLSATFYSINRGMAFNKIYAEEKTKMMGLIADYLTNILSVKIFTTKNYELARFRTQKQPFLDISYKQGYYFMNLYGFLGIFSAVYTLLFILFLVKGYQEGTISPGDFTFVVITNFNIIHTTYHLSYTIINFSSQWGSVDQALSLLETPLDVKDAPNAKNLAFNKGDIIFDHVKFHYKGASPLFEDLSVKLEAGQKIGLVGFSGSGKTTFVNLISRLSDVTEGTIFIDGQDIRDVAQDSLRNILATIPQDPPLFHRSILENIRYGRLSASDQEVFEAAKGAHAHDFIMDLPLGYETLVGERGLKLSGGQRQRIAIARAFLKNSPILILDEATSQLDSRTEHYIQESLWNLMEGKTTLVVAHRLSTLLHMDRILVFDQGKIVEDGSHEALLKRNGLYKSLWDAQIGGFLPEKRLNASHFISSQNLEK